jgi:hypothetical protein
MDSHDHLGGWLYIVYVNDVVPHRKLLWASTVCYGDSFTYVADVPTSQETRLWTSTAPYEDSFPFLYVVDVRTSRETRLSQ